MTKQILVVDDDRLNAALVREICESAGYSVLEVYNGESAVDLLRREPPDLVLLDIMMGQMDGFEVCETIRADPKTRNIPIIMVTAVDDLESKIRSMEIGADDYITKPFRMFDLLTRVRNVLESRQDEADPSRSRSKITGQMGDFRQLSLDLAYEVKRAKRYTHPLTCALLVLEGYDRLFREERATEANELLNRLMPMLHANLREVDRIYRIDDDVFIVIMPETDASSAEVSLARLKKVMESSIPIPPGVALDLNQNLVSFPSPDIVSAHDMLKLVASRI